MATDARQAQVAALLETVTDWASRRADVQGLALVGSYARDTATPQSDVDLVLLTRDPEPYLSGEDWVTELGGDAVVRTRDWGTLTERRFVAADGLEVEHRSGAEHRQ